MKNLSKIIYSLLIVFVAGGIGSLATFSQIPTWFANIQKPVWNPPNYLFGPVWTTLYILIAISLYLVWTSKQKNKKMAYTFFYLQLALNSLWSIIFFGFHALNIAFGEVILLWLSILFTIIYFIKINKFAGYILLPYLLWVTFASILNLSIAMLN